MTANEELIKYIIGLTPEEAKRALILVGDFLSKGQEERTTYQKEISQSPKAQ